MKGKKYEKLTLYSRSGSHSTELSRGTRDNTSAECVDVPWRALFVNNVADISVVYNGSTRIVYLASDNDSLLRASGSPIVWTNKPYANPKLVVADPANTNIVYAAKLGTALSKSTNGGDTWNVINSGIGNTPITALSVSHLNSNLLYFGTKSEDPPPPEPPNNPAVASLFISTNGGSSWAPVTGGLPSQYLTVTRIVFHPTDDRVVYVSGTGTSGGVWKSTNEGTSWGSKNNGIDNLNVISLTVSQVNTNLLLTLRPKSSMPCQ